MRSFKSYALALVAAVCAAIATPVAAQVIANVPTTLADRFPSGAITTQNLAGNATFTCTSGSCVIAQNPGSGSAVLTITGTWTGSMGFQYTVDQTNWISANAYPYPLSSSPAVQSTTANGQWLIEYAGMAAFRVVMNSAMTGTAQVSMDASAASAITNANQGAPAALANSWPMRMTDSGGNFAVDAHLQSQATQPSDHGFSVMGQMIPAASPNLGGELTFSSDSVTTVQQVKASQGQVYSLYAVNTTSATAYLQLFCLPSGSVTLGTTTPTIFYRLPYTASVMPFVMQLPFPTGLCNNGTGISIAGTTTATGSSTAALSVSLTYQ